MSSEEPTWVTVDRMFGLVQQALAAAIEHHGDVAKAFAWDVFAHLEKENGHLRARAQSPEQVKGASE